MDDFARGRSGTADHTAEERPEETSRVIKADDGENRLLRSLLARAAPSDLIRVMPVAGRHPDEAGGLRRSTTLRAGATVH
jgi:hypothetical protein